MGSTRWLEEGVYSATCCSFVCRDSEGIQSFWTYFCCKNWIQTSWKTIELFTIRIVLGWGMLSWRKSTFPERTCLLISNFRCCGYPLGKNWLRLDQDERTDGTLEMREWKSDTPSVLWSFAQSEQIKMPRFTEKNITGVRPHSTQIRFSLLENTLRTPTSVASFGCVITVLGRSGKMAPFFVNL